ncbi:Crp/Fnr family transcriptional regulator [Flavihumibacter rivuli]|uniref:Crp/Fnr family transcriptional regulator n=1 Tax=Flavihumibacter rivuli TaxID=2838156 RepID=UPI001BDF18FD|nr:Crp/Fnr family transcriptional regulator [Flavihumibacter rivuli]
MWQSLIQNIAKKGIILDEEETSLLQSSFRIRQYKRNQFILQQGDISRHESFVVSGLARMYLVDRNGRDHIVYFGIEDHWIGDLRSHYLEKPSDYNIECIEPTLVLQINKNELEVLSEKIPKLTKFFLILYRNSIIWHESRTVSALSKTTLQRYQDFREKYAHLEQRVPLQQIASYLGVTPQSLSRIRRQYQEKK